MAAERPSIRPPMRVRKGPKEPRGLARLLGLVLTLLVAIWLISRFIGAVFLGGSGWQEAEFETVMSRFQYHVALTHAEWLRQGQPQQVTLTRAELNEYGDVVIDTDGLDDSLVVTMSRWGWPSLESADAAGCMRLWTQLGSARRVDQDIVIRSVMDSEQGGSAMVCEFLFAGEVRFRYHPKSGRFESL
ncbi:MAG: hypothetical protein JJU10_10000 [Idiomarina sp.]|nr:hypothetical protein [Idiomarina sp.]